MYDLIARYYDLSHDRLVEDIPLLLRLAGETGGPVLEIGAGSGRLLVPLARAGFGVTGIDLSDEMLARAEARLAGESADTRANVRLVAADVRSLVLPGDAGFGLAIFGYNTFMHLDEATAGTALKRLRPLLRPDGRLLIDVANPMLLSMAADDPEFVLEEVLRDDARGGKIRQYTAYEAVPGEQAVDVSWLYEDDRGVGENDEPKRVEVHLRYHYLYPHQYDLLLSLTGYRLTSIAGGYKGEPFDEESDRLILLAVPE